jgi:hypothetical protein
VYSIQGFSDDDDGDDDNDDDDDDDDDDNYNDNDNNDKLHVLDIVHQAVLAGRPRC